MERKAINYDFLCDLCVCVFLTALHPFAITTAPVHFRPRSTIIIVWLRSIRYILYARTVSFQVRRMSPAVFAFLLFIVFRPTDTIHALLPLTSGKTTPLPPLGDGCHCRILCTYRYNRSIILSLLYIIIVHLSGPAIYAQFDLHATRAKTYYELLPIYHFNLGKYRHIGHNIIVHGRRNRTRMGWKV